jgi:phosphomannomutase
VTSPANSVAKISAQLAAQGVEVDLMDGLTAQFSDWWFNLRPSNTEPLLRLNVEAPDAEICATRVKEVLALVAEAE